MKSHLIAGAFILLICGGCAVVKIQTPKWSMHGYSVFKSIEVPRLIVNGTNGDVVVEGYRGTVDGEALGATIGAAIKTAGGLK